MFYVFFCLNKRKEETKGREREETKKGGKIFMNYVFIAVTTMPMKLFFDKHKKKYVNMFCLNIHFSLFLSLFKNIIYNTCERGYF